MAMKAQVLIFVFGCIATGMACTAEEAVEVETPVIVQENPKECRCDELYHDLEVNAFKYSSTDLPYSGSCRLLWEDGSLQAVREYEAGMLHGTVKEWHQNGQMKSERSFKKNLQHGIYNEWDEAGELTYSATYKKGKIEEVLTSKGNSSR